MTDLELLDLVHQKHADELSLAEIDELRKAVMSSPELRREFAERLEMEQYLAHALARVNVSIDDIIAKAGSGTARVSGAATWVLALFAVVGAAIGLGLVLVIVSPRNAADQKQTDSIATSDSSVVGAVVAVADKVDKSAKKTDAPQPAENPAPTAVAVAGAKAEPPVQVAQAPAAQPVANAPVEPWDLDVADAAVSPDLALFAGISDKSPAPQAEELKKWFANVDGQRGDFGVRDLNGGRWGVIEGLVRLRAPLKPGTALRMAIWDYNALRIHFWAGKSGVTLDYFELPSKPWIAYQTTRKESEPIPASFVLAGRDEERFWRTNPKAPAVIDIRHADGLLTLSAGDVRVLSVPMPVAPTEIYFEGNAIYRQISMVRAAELPAEPAPHPVTAEIVPAQQTWLTKLEPSDRLKQNDDGSAELIAEKNQQFVWAGFELRRTGVQELIFEIEKPQFGTGIYLGDAEGKPRYVMAFFRDQQNNAWTQIGPLGPSDGRLDASGSINERPMPYVGSPCWIKLVFGAGTLKTWTSIDGVQWARAADPSVNLTEGFNTVGLYASQGEPARSIKLRKVTLRDFEALNGLASPERRAGASEFVTLNDIVAWSEAVKNATPTDADKAEWMCACAIRRLAYGTNKELGDELLQLLWRDSLRMKLSTDARLRLLDDMALLAPTWDDPARATRYVDYYRQLGTILADLAKPRVFSRIVAAQMRAPILNLQTFRYLPEALARREMLELVLEKNWQELAAANRRFNYFNFPEQTTQADFYKWTASLAAQQLPKDRSAPTAIAGYADWRHPLVTELSKEGFNVLADLRVALESQSFRDACQVISSATSNGMLGLLPDTQDPDLTVSLPATVALAMREHPGFGKTMNEQYGPLGRLRVRQAIETGDAQAVEAATLQFYGTDAAAQAHLWLGDRALSAGAFADAQGHYRRARQSAPEAILNRLAASEQIAAALMGRDGGQSPSGVVEFGEAKLSAAEVKQLATDLRTARVAETTTGQSITAARLQPLPPAREYNVAAKARFEGEVGENPAGLPGDYGRAGAGWPPLAVDWVARQMSTLVAGDRLLASNRFQLASYDLNTGVLQWRAGLGGDQTGSHDWQATPMRPLATATRAFVRRLHKSGPVLAGIDLTNGQVLWETKLENERWVISDPALVQGTLYACTVQHTDVEYVLSLSAFDPETGVMLRERPLVNLRESWWRTRDCQMLTVDEAFVIECGGSLLQCDLLGNIRWARRQLWIPPSVDWFWMYQAQSPPVLADGRLIVLQIGVPTVTALEPDSGRLVWQRLMPGARRILAIAGAQVYVETNSGVQAVDAKTGNRLWQYDTTELLDGYAASTKDGLLVAIREPIEKENNKQPTLVWLDDKTGKPKFQQSFPQFKHEQPYLGPFVVRGDHLWAFYGKVVQDPTRDLLEFTPK